MQKRISRVLMSISPLVLVAGLALAGPPIADAHWNAQQEPPPDNTAKNLPTNHRDPNRADQQSVTNSDVATTRKIREAISQDKSLSTYAHNVKVITRNGVVHLKGPVRSQSEKKAIESKAGEIAGASNVKDELTIKTGNGA
jgi:hypothetical protein